MTTKPQVGHPDGTLCLEGTTSLPSDFQPCCDVFAAHTATCAHDLRYEWWPTSRRWVIAIAEAAGGGGDRYHALPPLRSAAGGMMRR